MRISDWSSDVCSSDLCHEAGMPLLADYHGGDMEGAFLTDATQRDGWRCSTEKAFLRPARERANLTIMTRSQADTITFDGRRAPGVQITPTGRQSQVRARTAIRLRPEKRRGEKESE